jgi:hypothetical protein
MQRILAIARLTWKSAFRYRLFWVMAVLLGAAVVGLPLILKSDDTAEGLCQILLTYTLTAITVLLGFATLWLSCGTLARDVEDCQIQVVCSKPIARWQVWLGKLMGILALNAMLLAISGGAVYGLLNWRANQLPADQRDKIRSEIFVARAAAKERPPDLSARQKALADAWFASWRQDHPHEDPSPDVLREKANYISKQVLAEVEELSSTNYKTWKINLSRLPAKIREEPMQLRVKFRITGDPDPAEGATCRLFWRIGPPESPNAQVLDETLPPNSFQELPITPLLDSAGVLTVVCFNANNVSLTFPVNEGFEVLYRESTFGINFIRGLMIILCWLILLSAIGLAAASFLSFPVAAFCSLAVLLVGLSTSTLSAVQDQKSIFPYSGDPPGVMQKFVDSVAVPAFAAVLKIVNLVQDFSPVESLSTGHSITWGQLGRAFGQIVLLMGGIFGVVGVLLFNRRELAAPQSNG